MLIDDNDVARIDPDTRAKLVEKFGDRFDEVVERSARSTQWQTSATFRSTVSQWPRSILWSVLFSLAIVTLGYDSSILSSFFAQPAFTARFGDCSIGEDGTESCEISSPWQQGLTNGAWIGSIIGLQLAGSAAQRWGHLKVMLVSIIAMTGFIFIPFFATSLPIFLAGQILQGLPWGSFQSLASAYASEITPVALRPLLTTYVNLCWVFGQLLSAGVLRATVLRTDQWAWKIPYAVQFFWPIPVFICCMLAPESPWWLTRNGKDEQAHKSIARLISKSNLSPAEAEEKVKDYQAMIQYTVALEDINEKDTAMKKGSGYLDCLKGVDRRRTEIACWAWLIQITSGSPLQGYSSYFFTKAGLSTINAFNMSMAMYAAGAVGTILSWFLINRVGRRTMYLGGLGAMFSTMLITGILGCLKQSEGVSWGVGAMLLLCTFFYDLTVGPVCFSIIAEVSSTRLRSKTIVLACNTYNLALIVANILNPNMLNTDNWNLGAKAGFFWAGTGALSLVWTYFRLPELAGRTYGELDVLFGAKVPARKFASTTIDQFKTISRDSASADMEKSSTNEKDVDAGSVTHLPALSK
ncbi:sugar transporter [Testicularia cyperi]|uniref:Sugar transporter n=1 Tax=Testicularia cyperi TaxID=1882483 RepID=A0A317XFB9_9BASI|nr:sugar transporter [Testicularia cyperi]